MSLIIIPEVDGDSFVSVDDADAIITSNSVQHDTWLALTEAEKEVYLRIATTNILNVVSTDNKNVSGYFDETTYVASESCLPKVNALMAVHDLVYGLSSEINPNMGTITKEKVGDLEVQYHNHSKALGRNNNRFPRNTRKCLNSYGANLQNGNIKQATLVRG